MRCHKHHYAMWGFASFAVIKAVLLVTWAIWWLSLVQTNASFTDPVAACAQVTEISTGECQTLLTLYNNTKWEDRTTTTHWWDMTNISNWYGINVIDGHVSKIMLWKNNLVGDIPSEIGNLSYLERFDVYDNQITSLPTEIEKLINLKYFYIYNNELTTLPPEIVRLVNLEWLYLNGNKLITLPLEMSHFTKLIRLNLGNNRLTSLPAELEYLTNLEYLNIKNNDIDTTLLSPSMNDFIISKVWQDREMTQCSVQRDCTSVYYNDLCWPCSAETLQTYGNAHGSAQQTEENITDATYSPEINSAYQWAYQIGITTMPNIQIANMEGSVIRSELAKMITEFTMKILDKQPDLQRDCTFDDTIQETEETQFYIKTACQLGLMGINMTNFEPNTQATRAQIGTVISRALYGTLHDQWDPYYVNHLNALKVADIISDTNPDLQEIRWYVMLMLYRTQ